MTLTRIAYFAKICYRMLYICYKSPMWPCQEIVRWVRRFIVVQWNHLRASHKSLSCLGIGAGHSCYIVKPPEIWIVCGIDKRVMQHITKETYPDCCRWWKCFLLHMHTWYLCKNFTSMNWSSFWIYSTHEILVSYAKCLRDLQGECSGIALISVNFVFTLLFQYFPHVSDEISVRLE
jgi:hypothetical protein